MTAHRLAIPPMVLSICACAARAGAAGGDGAGSFSILGSFVQMIASLAVVVGLILLFSHFAGKWARGIPGSRVPRYIRLIETRHLGPKKSLMLVEVGGDYLLVGDSAEGLRLIKQVDMLEEIEVVNSREDSLSTGGIVTSVVARFRGYFARPHVARATKPTKTPPFSFLGSEGGRG